jgi:hypothetical protein
MLAVRPIRAAPSLPTWDADRMQQLAVLHRQLTRKIISSGGAIREMSAYVAIRSCEGDVASPPDLCSRPRLQLSVWWAEVTIYSVVMQTT